MEGWGLGSVSHNKRNLYSWLGVLQTTIKEAKERGSSPTVDDFRRVAADNKAQNAKFHFECWSVVQPPDDYEPPAENENIEVALPNSNPVNEGSTAMAQKIYDYKVLGEKTQQGLVNEVKKHLADGWQPLGGVGAAAFGMSPIGGNQYIQAMVRYG